MDLGLKVGTYLLNCSDNLFTAVRHPEMSWTNNIAERMLRRFVIRRKVIYRFATMRGAQRYCIIASNIETWKLQNRDPDEELYRLFDIAPS